jgi:hypothetical protein
MMEDIGLPAVSHLRLKIGLDLKKGDRLWYCLQHIGRGAKMHRNKMVASISLYHNTNPKYLAAYTTPTAMTSSPKNFVVHDPIAMYLSPILPPTVRENVLMGMMGTP